MKKVLWIASHGPDRSHDTLNSATFERREDAMKFVAEKPYWRISRMEYREAFSPGIRTDEIGGVDVVREVEKVRQQAEYETGRRVSTKKALTLWRQRMHERHGPGGAMRNPRKKRTFAGRTAKAGTDVIVTVRTSEIGFKAVSRSCKRFFKGFFNIPPEQWRGNTFWVPHDAGLPIAGMLYYDLPFTVKFVDESGGAVELPTENPRRARTDFTVFDLFSDWAFAPNTKAAEKHARSKMGIKPSQWRGPVFLVKARAAEALANRLEREGWKVAGENW